MSSAKASERRGQNMEERHSGTRRMRTQNDDIEIQREREREKYELYKEDKLRGREIETKGLKELEIRGEIEDNQRE